MILKILLLRRKKAIRMKLKENRHDITCRADSKNAIKFQCLKTL